MTDFEERRLSFLNKIVDNRGVIELIVKYLNDTSDGIKFVYALTIPNTENELAVAEIIYSIFNDIIEMSSRLPDETEKLAPEENMGIAFLIKCINKIKNNEEFTVFDEKTVPKTVANVAYGLYMALTNYDESFEYMAGKLGMNLDIESDLMEFINYIDEMQKRLKVNKSPLEEIANFTQEGIEEGKAIAYEFHRLCVESKIEHNDESKDDKLVREMTRAIIKAFHRFGTR